MNSSYYIAKQHKKVCNKQLNTKKNTYSMSKIILIEKSGEIKQTTVKNYDETELFKKCGFKSAAGFEMAHAWTAEFNSVEYKLCVYGKTTGKAGSENKYEFPPPLDSTLFFGACVAVLKTVNDDVLVNMSESEFNDIIEFLFGGFEDLGSEDSEDDEDESLSSFTNIPKTKEGYAKDDFVVDDDDDDDELDTKTKSKPPAKKTTKPVKEKSKIVKKKPSLPEDADLPETPSVLQCSEELVEEDYI